MLGCFLDVVSDLYVDRRMGRDFRFFENVLRLEIETPSLLYFLRCRVGSL